MQDTTFSSFRLLQSLLDLAPDQNNGWLLKRRRASPSASLDKNFIIQFSN